MEKRFDHVENRDNSLSERSAKRSDFPYPASIRPTRMAGIGEALGRTFRIEIHRPTLLNHIDLLKGKVTLTSDDPH